MTGECLIRLFYKVTGVKISMHLAKDHYAYNLQREKLLGDGYILSQYEKTLSDFKFGKVSAAYAGCAAVAIYNALRFLNMPASFSEIVYHLEQGRLLSLSGKMGTNPCRLSDALNKMTPSDVKGAWKCFRDPSQLEKWKNETKTAAILAIWNDRSHPGKGMHFYMLCSEGKGWKAMNRQDGSKKETVYASAADSLGKGRLILGYCFIA